VRITIDDPTDPRLADYLALHGRRTEHDEYFIVETPMVIRRLLGSRFPVRSLLLLNEQAERLADVLPTIDAPVYVVGAEVMNATAGFNVHRGALASAGRLPLAELGEVLSSATRLLILEGSNDHQNLGVIARSARALGIDALLLDPTCADPFYRRSVRVSMGELLYLPVVRCAAWPAAIDQVAAAGFDVWALTPAADAVDLRQLQRSPLPPKVALLVGAEGSGLTGPAMAAATLHVRIGMHRDVDSLNVGHATAIALAAIAPDM
jgi:tRNA G18 (ribose-2'-O)-methylase SpoU